MIRSPEVDPNPTTFLPPPGVEETTWDILLALHSDRRCELPLDRLAGLASVSRDILAGRLELLEQRQMIVGARHRFSGEVRAALTPAARELLDRYLSAAGDLHVGAPH